MFEIVFPGVANKAILDPKIQAAIDLMCNCILYWFLTMGPCLERYYVIVYCSLQAVLVDLIGQHLGGPCIAKHQVVLGHRVLTGSLGGGQDEALHGRGYSRRSAVDQQQLLEGAESRCISELVC